MTIQEDYRPKDFDEVYGNKSVIKSLKSVLDRETEDLPHAWLFEGAFGCGKTTLARILSEKLGCSIDSQDHIEINCGNYGKIETVREIEKSANYKPMVSDSKIWILDEAHALGVGGASSKNMPQRALLKILEDCPKHCHIILCTTDSNMLIKTIRSRCHTFKVQTLDDDTMKNLILDILEKERVDDFPKEGVEALIENADGHPRDALKILDQVIDLELDSIVDAIHGFKTSEAQINELYWGMKNNLSWKKLSAILRDLKQQGEEPEKIRRTILGINSAMMLKPGVSSDDLDIYMTIGMIFDDYFKTDFNSLILKCYEGIS